MLQPRKRAFWLLVMRSSIFIYILYRRKISYMALGKSMDKDSDKPFYHVMPRDGWLNGRKHLAT
jgi:hypothetical protein